MFAAFERTSNGHHDFRGRLSYLGFLSCKAGLLWLYATPKQVAKVAKIGWA